MNAKPNNGYMYIVQGYPDCQTGSTQALHYLHNDDIFHDNSMTMVTLLEIILFGNISISESCLASPN
jgi:hypothetical protein